MEKAIAIFKLLFAGSQEAYGLHVPDPDSKEGVKAKGMSFTKREPLTEDLYEQHLDGVKSIGVVPIFGDKINFFALDIDEYPSQPERYCALVAKNNLPLQVFRSKSGGVHLYCFFNKPVLAAGALALIPSIKVLLGLAPAVETFPKQARVQEGGVGNWINLPYYNLGATKRYMLNAFGDPLPFVEAMDRALSQRTTLEALSLTLKRAPFNQAPPCLQALYLQDLVVPSNRNIFLFNTATYLKLRFKDNFSEKLALVNQTLLHPLAHQELISTIVASHEKGTYSYQCTESCLMEYCNKDECVRRKYGKAQSAFGDFTFERLVQVGSSTPYYKWTVNGVEMTFYSEAELRDQNKFCDYCMRYLHKIPHKMKNQTWTEVLSQALENMETEQVKQGEEVSSASLWYAYFKEFIDVRMKAESPAQILTGLVYPSEDDHGYYFRVEDLLQYMEVAKRYRETKIAEVHYKLNKIGARAKKIKDPSTERMIQAWFCPESALDFDSVSLGLVNAEQEEGITEVSPEMPLYKAKKKKKTDEIRKLLSTIEEKEEEF